MDVIGLWGIFTTGLLTGGLSCLAVQGGLLATAIARPVEATQGRAQRRHKGRQASAPVGIQLSKDPRPVIYFLGAKWVAYTLLGALLGAVGSALKLSPEVQAAMLILAGLYMLVTALNMLNVHPIFRYFMIQPPKFLTRFVRQQAKSDKADQWFTPAFLGFLTVLIPCGVTLSMEGTAIASGNALYGMIIMAVFTLGTSVTFFVLGFLATQIRGKVQPAFALIAALLVLGLGLWSVNSGLNLAGSPLSVNRMFASLTESPSAAGAQAQIVDGVQEVTINVRGGYSPNVVSAKSGVPTRLRLVTNETYDCSRAFVIPSLRIQRVLPATGETIIDLPAQQAGYMYFACSMGMYTGVVNFN